MTCLYIFSKLKVHITVGQLLTLYFLTLIFQSWYQYTVYFNCFLYNFFQIIKNWTLRFRRKMGLLSPAVDTFQITLSFLSSKKIKGFCKVHRSSSDLGWKYFNKIQELKSLNMYWCWWHYLAGRIIVKNYI